jgi:hypothetical protein
MQPPQAEDLLRYKRSNRPCSLKGKAAVKSEPWSAWIILLDLRGLMGRVYSCTGIGNKSREAYLQPAIRPGGNMGSNPIKATRY